MSELTEAFEKCNTTAGKLSEACRLVDALTAKLAKAEADRDAAQVKLARVWEILNGESALTDSEMEEAYTILNPVNL